MPRTSAGSAAGAVCVAPSSSGAGVVTARSRPSPAALVGSTAAKGGALVAAAPASRWRRGVGGVALSSTSAARAASAGGAGARRRRGRGAPVPASAGSIWGSAEKDSWSLARIGEPAFIQEGVRLPIVARVVNGADCWRRRNASTALPSPLHVLRQPHQRRLAASQIGAEPGPRFDVVLVSLILSLCRSATTPTGEVSDDLARCVHAWPRRLPRWVEVLSVAHSREGSHRLGHHIFAPTRPYSPSHHCCALGRAGCHGVAGHWASATRARMCSTRAVS